MNNKGIKLRPYEESDAEETLKWINDPDIKKAVNRSLPVSYFEHIEWYKKLIQDKSQVMFAIETEADKKYIGNCGLRNIDVIAHKAEMWIYIGEKDYYGRGIGSEATLKLLHYSFNFLNLNRVYLYAAAYNKKALKLYEKVGFVKEGIFRQDIFMDGEFHDTIWMSILRNEFTSHLPAQ